MRIGKPYNKGDEYEEKITKIMKSKGILPEGFERAGAGNSADSIFVHKGKSYNLEIKKDLFADYGQKMITWSESDGWNWSVDDEVTQWYTSFGVMDYLRKKGIIPNKHRILNGKITKSHKKQDQKNFEDTSLKIDGSALLDFYKIKNTFYMQVGDGYGFYCLSGDPAKLGASKFWTSFTLRLRAKTIHSKPTHDYAFYAVLKVKDKPEKSQISIDPIGKQKFPPIKP